MSTETRIISARLIQVINDSRQLTGAFAFDPDAQIDRDLFTVASQIQTEIEAITRAVAALEERILRLEGRHLERPTD